VILFDTGPIVAAAFTTEHYYQVCTELFAGLRLANRRLFLPATVAAEAGYLIDKLGGPERESGFLAGVADGGFEPVELTPADYARMSDLVLQYADLHLGTTDASIVAVAERLGVTEIATIDRRHFTAVRPRHVEAFTLLPERL